MAITLKAGRYYIGDPCYVLRKNWGTIVDLIFAAEGEDAPVILPGGQEAAVFGTAYGDGEYEDTKGNSYPVDAGLLSAVPVEALDVTEEEASENGLIQTFEEEFEAQERDGVITFGTISIDTN